VGKISQRQKHKPTGPCPLPEDRVLPGLTWMSRGPWDGAVSYAGWSQAHIHHRTQRFTLRCPEVCMWQLCHATCRGQHRCAWVGGSPAGGTACVQHVSGSSHLLCSPEQNHTQIKLGFCSTCSQRVSRSGPNHGFKAGSQQGAPAWPSRPHCLVPCAPFGASLPPSGTAPSSLIL
jgi:hypothetical protein